MEHPVGAFSAFREIEEREEKIFEKAIEGILGVGYLPLAVATQIVRGTIYAFFCKSTIVYPDAVPYNTIVYVLETPNDEGIYLLSIKTVEIVKEI